MLDLRPSKFLIDVLCSLANFPKKVSTGRIGKMEAVTKDLDPAFKTSATKSEMINIAIEMPATQYRKLLRIVES